MNNVLKKVILEILREFRGDRTSASNEPQDLFKGIPQQKVHEEKYYFDSYINEEGEAVTDIYFKNEDGSKGKFIIKINSELLRMQDSKMHTGFKGKNIGSIK